MAYQTGEHRFVLDPRDPQLPHRVRPEVDASAANPRLVHSRTSVAINQATNGPRWQPSARPYTRDVSYDPALLRMERFHAEIGHHAAFNYWNLRGILAEKWGHGPIFGARGEGPEQVHLTPETGLDDRRLQGVYGLMAAGVLAEGPECVPRGCEIALDWFGDHLSVMKPKRVVRTSAQVFAIYPAPNPVQLSRKIRSGVF